MDANSKDYWLEYIEKDKEYPKRALILDIFDAMEKEKNYIGKKDIEGKKIYANYSIVEFDYSGDPYTVKIQGYFYFNTDALFYEIRGVNYKNNKSEKLEYCINEHKISNLKIIDTIQENKLGLIKR